jgi:hypothetical protein
MPREWHLANQLAPPPVELRRFDDGPIQNCHFQGNTGGVMGFVVSLADNLLVRVRMPIFNDVSDEGKLNERWPWEYR